MRQDALAESLRSGHLAGAALDCFTVEPPKGSHPLTTISTVITAPHCIGWTNELFRDIGAAACDALVKMSNGERPACGVVNPEVFDRPSFQQKWKRIAAGV